VEEQELSRPPVFDAATELTISTFDFLIKDPAIGRAEALRRVVDKKTGA
jgi:hypothetical protein